LFWLDQDVFRILRVFMSSYFSRRYDFYQVCRYVLFLGVTWMSSVVTSNVVINESIDISREQ